MQTRIFPTELHLYHDTAPDEMKDDFWFYHQLIKREAEKEAKKFSATRAQRKKALKQYMEDHQLKNVLCEVIIKCDSHEEHRNMN